MKKIAVFVEGQGELIFVRRILYHLIDPSKFSFRCLALHADSEHDIPYPHNNPNAEVHYQIINMGNDEKVLSAIKEREEILFSNGFSKIIGLRDMYSREYRVKSGGAINENLNRRFIESTRKIISALNNAERINFHFSIMELETWWISMYNLFAKINDKLTVNFIDENLGCDLSKIDPQTEFFHPSTEFDRILHLVGSSYDKRFSEVESISSKIDDVDIENATENNRCRALKSFSGDLTRF